METYLTMKTAAEIKQNKNNEFREHFGLGFINTVLSICGYCVASVPIGRNLMALKMGASDKIYLLLCAIILLIVFNALLNLLNQTPLFILKSFNLVVCLNLIDTRACYLYYKYNKAYFCMIMMCAIGMIIIDLSTCLGIILLLSLVQYFFMSYKYKLESCKNQLYYYEEIPMSKNECKELSGTAINDTDQNISKNSSESDNDDQTDSGDALQKDDGIQKTIPLVSPEKSDDKKSQISVDVQESLTEDTIDIKLGGSWLFAKETVINEIKAQKVTIKSKNIVLDFTKAVNYDIIYIKEYETLIEKIETNG